MAKLAVLGLPVAGLPNGDRTILFRWPLAQDYEIVDGVIRSRGSLKERGTPLGHPDLFASFARLSVYGEPSEAKILRWVRKYGLFTWEDKEQRDCGDPITVERFEAESLQAHYALTLFNALRLRNHDKLRPRITLQREPRGPYANAFIDGVDARHVVEYGKDLSSREVLSVALHGLQARVSQKVKLQLGFGMNHEHPRSLGNLFRPFPALLPHDLLSAAWLQFALYMGDSNREWDICVACGLPFLVTRKDQTTCPGSAACQKRRQRLAK